jgi:hypothetical protein
MRKDGPSVMTFECEWWECAMPGPSAVGEFLLAQGDAEVNKLVTGIRESHAWHEGRNAIVLVWDENDFANAPNNVVVLVETNYSMSAHRLGAVNERHVW